MTRQPLPALTVQQLEYLVAVADAPTWAEAAAELGVTPSALSQGLSQLERRLGVALFQRDGRRRRTRTEAEEVVRYARRVIADTGDLARWANTVRSGRSGLVSIGMIDVAAVHHYGLALQQFRVAHPDVELRLVVGPSAELVERLEAGAIGLAVMVKPEPATGRFETIDLLDEELAIYAPSSVTAPPPPDRWGPWVAFPEGSHTRQLIARRLVELGAPFTVVAESHQPEVLRRMVELAMGWTILPVTQAETEPAPLRRLVPEPLLLRTLVVARRHDRVADPASDAVIDHLVAQGHQPRAISSRR